MDTNAKEFNTYFDQRPTHRPVPKAVRDAYKKYEKACEAYDAYTEKFHGKTEDIDWDELNRLSNAVIDTELAVVAAKRAANVEGVK